MMTTNSNIPPGYKDSAVGIIPQEWKVKQLALLGKMFSGGTPSTDKEEYWGGNIMWCTPSDITSISSKYINNTKDRITAMGLKNSSAILLPINSIIVCTRATIGAAAITQVELSTNQGFKNIKPEKCNTEWLYYSMILNQPKLQRLGCGSTFLEVSKRDFERLKLAVPPIGEQRKIAEILGVWDEAIERQSRLIEKLELRKRALMQRLLTGRTRLPGFTTPWQKVKLGEIFKERNEMKCEHLPLLSITAERGVILQSESDKKDTSNDDKSKYKRICPNDIGYNTMRMWQGRSALSAMEGIVSPAYTIVTPKVGIDPLFISELIKQPRVVYDFWTHSQGLVGDTLNCKFHDFSQVKVVIPSLPEQKAIAEVLTAADNEIDIHRKKLDALRLQKRGLMQQLLTGKTRVKI